MNYLQKACKTLRMEYIPNEKIERRTGRVFTSADRIESKQLLWYGHVNRMNQERWPKIAMEYEKTIHKIDEEADQEHPVYVIINI